MRKTRQIYIKNQTSCFCNNQIILEDFDASLLKVDKKITKRLKFITLVM